MTYHRQRRRAGLLVAAACFSVMGSGLMSCSPVIAQRGYVVDEKELKKVQVGMTSRDEVQRIMGSPSTTSTIDGEAWYYISSTFETNTFHKPEEIDRTIVAVYFEKTPTVQEIVYYGLKDGMVVDLTTRTTPTRGKEMTILGQLFGNLGRFNAAGGNANKTGPGGNR